MLCDYRTPVRGLSPRLRAQSPPARPWEQRQDTASTSPQDRSKGCVPREPVMVGGFGLGPAQVSGDSQAVLTPSRSAPSAVGRAWSYRKQTPSLL